MGKVRDGGRHVGVGLTVDGGLHGFPWCIIYVCLDPAASHFISKSGDHLKD